eukprot:TRINITY_DN3104_c0_g1_i4.p1 TRINITY_DN3104_c0_g1~~TRINITY_DN3104_c0_g1_i4.p1  ORF type:complete len:106 (-),score=7.80 TRINITY_DN3104_c0_g1_i4:100-417(-)
MLLRIWGVIGSSMQYLGYVIDILFGLADSGFNTQIYAVLAGYQALFSAKTGDMFAVFKLFQAGSSAVMFIMAINLNMEIRIYLMNGILWVSMIVYLMGIKYCRLH